MKGKLLKSLTSTFLAAAITVGSLVTSSVSFADDTVYEFENGVIYDNGTEHVTTVIENANASGGKVVYLLDGINYDTNEPGDSVMLDVEVAEAGLYNLTIRYSQNFGEDGKYQNVVVNGTTVGQIFCDYTDADEFKTVTIAAGLNAGKNTVGIESSWGWTLLDTLTVSKGQSITVDTSGAQLSNPNATSAAKSLYSYLCDTYGKNIISGQQESTWMGSPEYEMNIIQNASGKLPAIRGLDYMNDDFSGVNSRAKAWHEKGGIVTIAWHCGSDFSGEWADAMADDLDWDKALTEGTAEYDALVAGMDKGAAALKELQDANIPVIWRPFHEFDGQWFWWGKGGGENFKKLWQIMYDRYTNHWGLNNLIWILGYSGGALKDGWYPGDDYVDIIGSDTYVDNTGSLVGMYQSTTKMSDKNVPICLHENGPIPDPAALQSDGAHWLWFMTWHTEWITDKYMNTSEHINYVYNSDYVITLDELPADLYTRTQSESGTTTTTTSGNNTTTTTTTTTSGLETTTTTTDEPKFEVKKYTIDVSDAGRTGLLFLKFEGTPDAYTNGCVGYSVGEDWTSIEWETTLDSDGKAEVQIAMADIPESVDSVEAQIWWAATYDAATDTNIIGENELIDYEILGQGLEVTVYGDADCSGDVEIADAVKVLCFITDPENNPIDEQGRINADVYQTGDGLSSQDALAIQKYLAQIIIELPEKSS